MAGSIGIKQANGEFYSILDENSAAKKRLVLTTVHDSQKSVQIDLYRSTTKNMADAMYIGSIVVENIGQKRKGEPSIEMTLSSTQDGSISASAVDLANPGNEHHLSISLKSLEEDKNDYPDFDIDTAQKSSIQPLAPPRKFPWLVIIIIGVVLALICFGLWFFLSYSKKDGRAQSVRQTQRTVAAQPRPDPKTAAPPPAAVPKTESVPAPAEKPAQAPKNEQEPATAVAVAVAVATPAAAPVAAPAAAPVIVEKPPEPRQQPAPRIRTRAPVYSFNVPETIPPEGIVYTIRNGDTLWDISEAFYRNPRLYPFIVRSNGIRNPNLIVSGTELTILPRV